MKEDMFFMDERQKSLRKDRNEVAKGVYSPEDIMRILGVSRSKAYDFLTEVFKQQSPFRVIKIGRLVRVPKQSFDEWLYGKE